MSVWFTSDPHLFHPAMAWMRRYGHWPTAEERPRITDSTLEKHNEAIADGWDRNVREDDQVWVLGDLTANNSRVDDALEWFGLRPGTKHLILGNHDPAHPMHRESHRWLERYFRAFVSVQTSAERNVTLPDGTKQRVMLSHFPYSGDGVGREDRCDQHRLRDLGRPVIHGHVHSPERITYAPVLQTFHGPENGTPQIHVGLDAWDMQPVSLEIVTRHIAQGLEQQARTWRCCCSGQGGSVYSARCPIHDPSVDVRDPAYRAWYDDHQREQAAIRKRLGWT